MRIGIDARFYGLGQAGLARYTQELIHYLSHAESPHTFVVFLRRRDAASFTTDRSNVEVRTTHIPHYTFREQLWFGRELTAAKLDLMHFTNFNFPIRYRGPFVISINDLTLLSFAGRSRVSRLKARPLRFVMRQGTQRSAKITTLSQHQKELIVREFAVDPDKIEVVYLAADERFKPYPAKDVADFRRQHQLEQPFIMYAGQWRQHKNLVRLIKAFRHVRDQLPAKLVFVGKIDPAFPIITETIKSQGLQGDVVLTDFIPDDELPLYYNAADVFAFPSLSEGFGLPPLEAMAAGTTVASSDAPPMPEILGQAAAYFDPYDTGSIVDTISTLLHDQKKREHYRQLGFQQVAKYSWQATARQTLAVYEAAIRR